MFTNRSKTTRYMKVKRMGITEILRRIWLLSANKIKSSESVSKQPIIVELNSSLRLIIVTNFCGAGGVSAVKGSAEGLISSVKSISSVDLDSFVELDSAVVLIESV